VVVEGKWLISGEQPAGVFEEALRIIAGENLTIQAALLFSLERKAARLERQAVQAERPPLSFILCRRMWSSTVWCILVQWPRFFPSTSGLCP